MKSDFNFMIAGVVGRPRETSMTMRLAVLGALLIAALGSAHAEAPSNEEQLRAAIAGLRAEVEALRAAAPDARVAELERRIDLLAAELEKLRTAGAADAAPLTGSKGFAPAAAKVYGIARGVSIGGYGEAVYENFASERQDDKPSGRRDQFDFLRQIVYVGYKFNDKILLNSEIEFEHASTGKGGEVSVEFAYLDYQLSK